MRGFGIQAGGFWWVLVSTGALVKTYVSGAMPVLALVAGASTGGSGAAPDPAAHTGVQNFGALML